MRSKHLAFFVFLFLSPIVFAGSCGDLVVARLRIPAIDASEGGVLVGVEVSASNGSGVVYTSTSPFTGVETQDSEKTAVAVAAENSVLNNGSCDVFFRFVSSGETRWVDGPSGGAAFALLSYSVFEQKDFRKGLTVTGTIENDGSIGAVGGIIPKTRAVLEAGYSVFIVPEQDFSSKIMLLSLMERWPIKVVEAKDFEELKQLAFSNNSITKEFSFAPREWVEVEALNSGENIFDEAFKGIVRDLIRDSRQRVGSLSASGSQQAFAAYLENELDISEKLYEKNFVYSAGNTAFLSGIDAGMVAYGDLGARELETKARNAAECVKSVDLDSGLNSGNFEWRVGGSVRLNWAEKKLFEASERGFDSADEQLQGLNDILFADGWCETARKISGLKTEGSEADELELEEFAGVYLENADALLSSEDVDDLDFEEARWHLEAASDAFDNGDYGASVFDSAMALSYAKFVKNFNDSSTNEELFSNAEASVDANLSGFWPRAYQSQAVYYLRKGNDSGNLIVAAKLGGFAKELDEASKLMNEIISGKTRALPANASASAEKSISSKTTADSAIDFIRKRKELLFTAAVGVGLFILISALLAFFFLNKKRRTARKKAGRKN